MARRSRAWQRVQGFGLLSCKQREAVERCWQSEDSDGRGIGGLG